MTEERKCQDCLFCLAMLGYWALMIYIFKLAVDSGNVANLLRPVDVHKNTCGMNNGNGRDFTTCTNLYFNDPLGNPESRICVESCPKTQLDIVCHCGSCGSHSNNTAWGTPETSTTPGVVPISDIVTWAQAKTQMDARPDDFTLNLLPGSRLPLPQVNGEEVGGYCIPSGNVTQLIMDTLGKDDTLTGGLKDGFTHRWPIIYGIITSVVVGFIFLYFVAWFTKPLAYLILTATVVASFLIFILSLYEGQRAAFLFPDAVGKFINAKGPRVPEDLAENQLYLDISTGFWGFVFVCSFVVLAAMRQRLAIAIGVVEESSRALVGMPTLLLVPIGSLLTMLLLLPFIGLGIGAVMSLRKWEDGGWVYTDEVKAMLAIYTFGAIWLFTFIDALQFTALAGAVCDWYFCMDKGKRQGGLDAATTLFRSYMRLVRYHLGSIAFGSFVVAVVKSIKYILAYISSQIQAQFPGNVAIKILIAVLNCCVACFERLVKYLTETAYIQIAIWGRNFCRSAFYGLKLSITNMGRLAFVTILSKCLIILGTIEISVSSAATCAFFIYAQDALPPMGYCNMESPAHLGKGVCTSDVHRPVDPKLAKNERVLGLVAATGEFHQQWETDLDPAVGCLTTPCDENTCLHYGTCQVVGQESNSYEMCGQCLANGAVDDQLTSSGGCEDAGGTWAQGAFQVTGKWHPSCEGEVSWDGPTINSVNELIMRPAVAIALIFGYLVGFVFMDCYDTTIHTIIICFCEDEKYCDGGDADMAPEDYPYYASGSLEEVLGPALKFGAKKKKSGREVIAVPCCTSALAANILHRKLSCNQLVLVSIRALNCCVGCPAPGTKCWYGFQEEAGGAEAGGRNGR